MNDFNIATNHLQLYFLRVQRLFDENRNKDIANTF